MGTKRLCEEEIGLCTQNWLAIVGPRVYIIGWGLYDHLKKKENLTFDNEFTCAPTIMRKMVATSIWIC